MNNTEVGCYIKLLCFCWDRGSIPNNIDKIAKLCNEPKEEMAQLWTAISPCFKNGNAKGRLINLRLDKERKKQLEFREERAASGKKGAEIRWKDKDSSANGLANSSAIKQPLAKNGSAVCSLPSSSSKKLLKHTPEKPSPKKTELEEEFEEFWKGYKAMGNSKNPIGDKGTAYKAFKALRKKIGKDELIKALWGEADYLKYERLVNNFDKRKKYVSTWLRSDKWREHKDFKYTARL